MKGHIRKNVEMIDVEASADEASKTMAEKGVDCLIALQRVQAAGIVTNESV